MQTVGELKPEGKAQKQVMPLSLTWRDMKIACAVVLIMQCALSEYIG